MLVYKAQWAKEQSCVSHVKKSKDSKVKVRNSEEVMPDEDCKMEIDSEAESRKKLDQRRREIAKQLCETEEFTDLDEGFVEGQDGKW